MLYDLKSNISLDGHDVAICIGLCEESTLPFWCRKITENGSTMVIVLFEETEEKYVKDFINNLKKHLFKTDGFKRRIIAMDVVDWNALYHSYKDKNFGIVHFKLNVNFKVIPLSYERPNVHSHIKSLSAFDDIPDIKDVFSQVANIFSRDFTDGIWPTLLLAGETGTGKSFAARCIANAVQELTKQSIGKFIYRNCGEFGKEEMNAVLFGVKGGMFSGVSKSQEGALAKAKNGILFLDEIGTLPLELQPRLLTLLDKGEYIKHGGQDVEQAKCRFIFGTNENLKKSIAEKRFRFDLYNRINGIEVRMPTVKERFNGRNGEMFFEQILNDIGLRHGKVHITQHGKELLLNFSKHHPWNGNFRDLMRLFQMLHMDITFSNQPNVLTASKVKKVLEKFIAQIGVMNFNTRIENPISLLGHPILTDLSGMYAKDKIVLAFAFECAKQSSNCSQAANMFYAGKFQKNPSASYVRFLERFGYRYDVNSCGHIQNILD